MKSTKHVRHFLVLRLVIALSGFVLIVLWEASRGDASPNPMGALSYVVVAAYSLEALLARAMVRVVKRMRLFVTTQVAVDLCMEGFLVASTGGAASVFCPLFFASIFAASTVLSVEGALVCSSSATIILAVACMLPQMRQGGTTTDHSWRLASYLFTYGLAFHGVSLLSSRVVRGVIDAERLTEEIIESMAEGLVAADREGRIIALNGKARQLLGVEPGRRLEGKPLDVLAGGRMREFVADKLRGCVEGRWEMACDSPDGQQTPVLVTTNALRDARGKLHGTVSLLQDLSLRREIEAASRRIAKLEELSEVARGIAHEVRNPLASMCGCAEEIAQDPNITPQTLRLTEILRREANRVDGIIDEFLNFARLQKLVPSRVDVGELLTHVGALLQARAERTEIRVERPCAPIEMRADRDLLTQLLLNLGINALEAIGHTEGLVRLGAARVQGRTGDAGVKISVCDNGHGIAREDQERVFTPFFSRKARGTGLGLAMAQRIALLHGGEIRLESSPGRGSSFHVWLPIAWPATEDCETTIEESVWT